VDPNESGSSDSRNRRSPARHWKRSSRPCDCQTSKDEEAKAAGADHVGYKDYLEKIQQGWADIDIIVATPDVMGAIWASSARFSALAVLMPNSEKVEPSRRMLQKR